MENTLTIFVESLNKHHDIPGPLCLKRIKYKKENPVDSHSNADQIHAA